MPRGRPSKLTPERKDAMLAHLRNGLTLPSAAALVDISPRTSAYWMERGQEAQSGEYFHFFQAVKKAEEEAQKFLLGDIQAAAQKQWQAAAWILERRWPDRYGAKMEVRGDPNAPIHVRLKWDEDPHE